MGIFDRKKHHQGGDILPLEAFKVRPLMTKAENSLKLNFGYLWCWSLWIKRVFIANRSWQTALGDINLRLNQLYLPHQTLATLGNHFQINSSKNTNVLVLLISNIAPKSGCLCRGFSGLRKLNSPHLLKYSGTIDSINVSVKCFSLNLSSRSSLWSCKPARGSVSVSSVF